MKAAVSYRGEIGDMDNGVAKLFKMRFKLTGFLVISFLALFAFASYTPVAYASSGYFAGSGGCTGCHSGQTGSNFCGMCHAHGVHASSSKSGINLTVATNKASYAPGETVSVTISGGYRASQARAILYDQSMTQVAISTGSLNSSGYPINAPVWPRTLSAPAPSTAGTYTWKAAWYGNIYDTGSATFGGANWVLDPNNPDHGEERVNVTVTVVAAAPTLSTITVVGATSVDEGAQSTYTATANWSDGTSTAATGATFSMVSGPATITSAGVLTGGSVTANTAAVIRGSYTSGGVTRTADATVTINNVAGTLSTITVVGATSVDEGAQSTYTATANWSDGTSTAATGATFSMVSGPATITSAGVLTGGSVTANTAAVIRGSYTSGGVTRTADATVTINNVAVSTGTLTVYPLDDADNVPRNTVITATAGDSSNIQTIFNSSTFTLRPASTTSDSSVGPSGPLSASVCVSGGIVQGSFTYNSANTTGAFTPNCELGEEKTYLAAVTNGSGSPLSAPVNWQFKTVEDGPDSDADGSPDGEDDDPHDGRKTSRWGSKGNGKIHIDVTDSAGAAINAAVALSDDNDRLNKTGKPAAFVFHDGLVAYNVHGITPGATITAKITFPSGIRSGSKVYRVDTYGFHEMTNVVINGNTVAMTLTDGGAGDSDGQANGVIVDPVGVAVPESESGTIGLTTGGASGGCAVAGRAGSGGDLSEAAGAYGFLTLAALGIALRGRIRRRKE